MSHKVKVFKAQIIALAALALSVFIMPICSKMELESGGNGLLIINGLLFWGSLLSLTAISVYFCLLRRRSDFTKQKLPGYKRLGLIHFWQNPRAKIADIIMIVSVVAFVGWMIWKNGTTEVAFFLLAIFLFSFGMHCLLNGAGYLYIQYDAGGKEK